MVWIIGWVGVAYVSAFIGNLWIVVNPWRTMFRSMREDLPVPSPVGGDFSLHLRYPAALGVWPAVVLLARACLGRARLSQPRGPTLSCTAGGRLFRPDLHRHVPVRLRDMVASAAKFSRWCSARSRALRRFEVRVGPRPQLWLRPFGVGLLDSGAVSTSMIAFVLLAARKRSLRRRADNARMGRFGKRRSPPTCRPSAISN